MKEKLTALFDSRATWMVLGSVSGTLWGDQATAAVNALGTFVMAIL